MHVTCTRCIFSKMNTLHILSVYILHKYKPHIRHCMEIFVQSFRATPLFVIQLNRMVYTVVFCSISHISYTLTTCHLSQMKYQKIFFKRLTPFMEDSLLEKIGNITHHGEIVLYTYSEIFRKFFVYTFRVSF